MMPQTRFFHPVRFAVRGMLILPLTLMGIRCDESLPVRTNPTPVTYSFSLVEGTVLVSGGVPTGRTGAIDVKVKNIYDEVLQDTENIEAVVTIRIRDMPDKGAVIRADHNDLVNTWILQGGVMTLGTDTTAWIARQWEHRTDQGVPFWSFVDSSYGVTLSGMPYWESLPITFEAEATVQVFKHSAPYRIHAAEYTLSYRRFI